MKNIRIKREPNLTAVTADDGSWMLTVGGGHGVQLWKPVECGDDDGVVTKGWMEAELLDALDREDDAFVDAFYAAHYPRAEFPKLYLD